MENGKHCHVNVSPLLSDHYRHTTMLETDSLLLKYFYVQDFQE